MCRQAERRDERFLACPTRAPSSPRRAWTRAAARRRTSPRRARRERALERRRAQAEHQARMSARRCCSRGRSDARRSAAIHAGGAALAIDAAARAAIRASAAVVQRAAAGDAPVYGVNTGFGKLAGDAHQREPTSATLQLNLIRSHSVGVGEPLAPRGGAADARAQGGEPRARPLGRARGGGRHAARGAQRRPRAVRAVAGLGRRVGRPRAAGAHDAGADRRRRDAASTASAVPAARALRDAGIAPLALAGEGRPRADQRHAGLDRARAARAASPSSRCSRRRSSSAR